MGCKILGWPIRNNFIIIYFILVVSFGCECFLFLIFKVLVLVYSFSYFLCSPVYKLFYGFVSSAFFSFVSFVFLSFTIIFLNFFSSSYMWVWLSLNLLLRFYARLCSWCSFKLYICSTRNQFSNKYLLQWRKNIPIFSFHSFGINEDPGQKGERMRNTQSKTICFLINYNLCLINNCC